MGKRGDSKLFDDSSDKTIKADGKSRDYQVKKTSTSWGADYSYNLEQAGYEISVNPSGNMTEKYNAYVSYGGNPTKYTQIEKLSGSAQYTGKSSIIGYSQRRDNNPMNLNEMIYPVAQDPMLATFTLQADFSNKRVSGEIAIPSPTYSDYMDKAHSTGSQSRTKELRIYLGNATISSDTNGNNVFKGEVSTNEYFARSSGEYQGSFMGENAEQVAGMAQISGRNDFYGQGIEYYQVKAVFAGDKKK